MTYGNAVELVIFNMLLPLADEISDFVNAYRHFR
jgi:hypothetical protein